jgi:hypothetical protein
MNTNQLIQPSIFEPLLPFIISIYSKEIDSSTEHIIRKNLEFIVEMKIPTSLKLDEKEIFKYFQEDVQIIYNREGLNELKGTVKNNDFAMFLAALYEKGKNDFGLKKQILSIINRSHSSTPYTQW